MGWYPAELPTYYPKRAMCTDTKGCYESSVLFSRLPRKWRGFIVRRSLIKNFLISKPKNIEGFESAGYNDFERTK